MPFRKYWEHWSSVASWATAHPGQPDAMPVAVYGDEAKVSEHSGDKFIALVLQSPLIRKMGCLFELDPQPTPSSFQLIYSSHDVYTCMVSISGRNGMIFSICDYFGCKYSTIWFEGGWQQQDSKFGCTGWQQQGLAWAENFLFFIVSSAIAVGASGIAAWLF